MAALFFWNDRIPNTDEGASKFPGTKPHQGCSVWKMGVEMYRRKALQSEYGPREILLFGAAGLAICFVAVLVMLAH
jgi:hypothetical protein